MPAKIARLATRPPFWIPEVSLAVRNSRLSCSKAEKREYSWQIGSHPVNPGKGEENMKRTRRSFVASTAATALIGLRPAQAADEKVVLFGMPHDFTKIYTFVTA